MNYLSGQIAVTYSVMCCGCGSYDTLFGVTSKSEAATKAKEGGWARTRAFGWICEDCDRDGLAKSKPSTGSEGR